MINTALVDHLRALWCIESARYLGLNNFIYLSMLTEESNISRRGQVKALYTAALYRPKLFIIIMVTSLFAASLEGIGIGFLFPIIKLAQDPATAGASSEVELFVRFFEILNLPFVIEHVVVAMAAVFILRYMLSFGTSWLRSILGQGYVRDLQKRAYDKAIHARISYFDKEGSDEVMNTIVTEARQAGSPLNGMTKIIEQGAIILMYTTISLYISPILTLLTAVLLALLTFVIRWWFESGGDIGERVAEANQEIQQSLQSILYVIRELKLFDMIDEFTGTFNKAVDEKSDSKIKLNRNEAAMNNFYNLATILTLLFLIYWGLVFSGLSFSSLGLFLFAMFRLAPRVSTLLQNIYKIEGRIPHIHRTQRYLSELDDQQEPVGGTEPVPDSIERITFENVDFSYSTTDETVFNDLSFSISGDEFTAFVGPSGAGKSTIASLLIRLYEPDGGGNLCQRNTDLSFRY
jgi:subfamily B ATP-binding cassette protein MsbA